MSQLPGRYLVITSLLNPISNRQSREGAGELIAQPSSKQSEIFNELLLKLNTKVSQIIIEQTSVPIFDNPWMEVRQPAQNRDMVRRV